WFVVFVGWSLNAMGIWAYLIFFVLFMFGSLMFGIMRGHGYVGEMQASIQFYNRAHKELKDLKDQRSIVMGQAATMNPNECAKRMKAIDLAEVKWQERLKAWKEYH
ncbi:MAG: hypothetical protein V1944_00365, partial [Candidatus Aenigmatarchaeota archaeon]